MEAQVRVGVAVFIRRGNQLLLGQRKNAHASGTWAVPGGHLEFGETWEACARREVLEETGLTVGAVSFFTAVNDFFPSEEKHYVTLCLVAEYLDGEPELLEPHKCEAWQWFDWQTLPHPLFSDYQQILSSPLSPFCPQNL